MKLNIPIRPVKWWMNVGIYLLKKIGDKYDYALVSEREVNGGKQELRTLRLNYQEKFKSTSAEMVEYFKKNQFAWERDPVHGILDYVSDPAITLARRRGDCDDLAALWSAIYPELKRFALLPKEIVGGHVVAVTRTPEYKYAIVSNMEVLGEYDAVSAHYAIKKVFGEKRCHWVMEFDSRGYVLEIVRVK